MIVPDEQFETMKRSLIKLSEEKELWSNYVQKVINYRKHKKECRKSSL